MLFALISSTVIYAPAGLESRLSVERLAFRIQVQDIWLRYFTFYLAFSAAPRYLPRQQAVFVDVQLG